MDARKDARGQHGRRKARALFIGPVGQHDRVAGLDVEVIQAADHLQPAQDPQHPVIAPAGGLGVQMAAHIDRQRARVGARAGGEHVAHRVDTHGAACGLAPISKNAAPFGIGIGQGLAVVAPRDARTDLGHLLQAVPKTCGIDAEVFPMGGHRLLPVVAVWGLDAPCDESFSDRMVRFKRTIT